MAEERMSLQELELRLKEEEIKLKQIETRAKERDIASSTWRSPLVIGVLLAAVGLFGNLVVAAINNANTQRLERARAQSNLMIEAIRTNGDTNAACRNLVFFLSLGLIEDSNHTITGACPGNVQGAPSVSVGPADHFAGHSWYPLIVHTVDVNGISLSGALIEADLIPSGEDPIEIPSPFAEAISHENYLGASGGHTSRCTSDKDGKCYLGMAPSGRFLAILAKRAGYVGDRTNTFFTGTSVVLVLQKAP
ncbi:MAG: hypothetical protein H0X25_02945 [Acidobacteriales bacterium]|nr:hypothetical protein [Terriglobales bacterium]